ncbi:MAG: transglycosylase SLT domain-containing protein [Chitinophagales bacterium]
MKLSFSFILTLAFLSVFSQDVREVNINDIKDIDNITFERLYQEKWFEPDTLVYKNIYLAPNDVPQLSADEIKRRLIKIPSSIPLNYNSVVKSYIDKFSKFDRKNLATALGLGTYYFPLFEEALYKNGVPLDFKYLPIVESNMNPFAKSYAGAQGMWQFMLSTGKIFGLEVNDYYDERRDPAIATEAAAKYLKKLYNIYDDWLLALAAYNAGPGNVNKAIARANGVKDFWEIRPYLPRETQEYVPKFTALVFVMNNADYYKITPLKPLDDLIETDTFKIYHKVSLKYILELSGMDSSYLYFVNPAIKQGIIPENENGFTLNIPLNYIGHFEALRPFFADDPYLKTVEAIVKEPAVPKYTVYKVKSGDTLGHIAQKYNVGVSNIKRWNKLSSDRLKIGQKLIIYN